MYKVLPVKDERPIQEFLPKVDENTFKKLTYVVSLKSIISLYHFHFENKLNQWSYRPTHVKLSESKPSLLNLSAEMLAIFVANKIQVKSMLSGDPDLDKKNMLMMAMRACFDPILFSNLFYFGTDKVEGLSKLYFRKLLDDGFFNNYEIFKVTPEMFDSELSNILKNLKVLGVEKMPVQFDLDDLILKYNLVVRDVTKYDLHDIIKIIVPLEVRFIFNRDPMKKIKELKEENPDLVTIYEDRLLDSTPETLLMKFVRSEFPNETKLYEFFKRFYDRSIDYEQLKENFDVQTLDERILKAIKYWKPETTDMKTYKYINYLNDINSDPYDKDMLLVQISGELQVDEVGEWSDSIEGLL